MYCCHASDQLGHRRGAFEALTERASPGARASRRGVLRARRAPIDRPRHRPYTPLGEPVAQMVEHLTFNQVVVGSSPTGLTIEIKRLRMGDARCAPHAR